MGGYIIISILSVYFDNGIPQWSTHTEKIAYNVLVLVVSGRVNYSINGKQITAEKGDFLFIPETTVRSGENHESGVHQKYTVIFNLRKDETDSNSFPINSNFYKFKTRNFEYVKQRFERLFIDARGDKKYRSFICNGILQELLGMFARELALENYSIPASKIKYARIIEHYLVENYRKSIEIEHLAKLISRSPSYTISIFKEVVGTSPIKYTHQLRIMEACNLLLNTDMTIVEISDYLGYYDPPYFSRMFKKFTSKSPKEFMLEGDQTFSKLFS
ncbi:AraC family transcriptional regulator [Neobacillus cucumis]|uniref:AraC family transcriptional regulator n=1 Tax=Neobacillus cucumis TaxID=1740721 RepID=UPI002E1ADADE|nr:AraC family transcriptional regulator [Neobacillus cucumis]